MSKGNTFFLNWGPKELSSVIQTFREVNSILGEVALLTEINVGRSRVATLPFSLLSVELCCNRVPCYQTASADRTGQTVSVLPLTLRCQHFTIQQQAR